MIEDYDRCYRAMLSNNARFDGQIIVGVHSTQIYCRPSCPVHPPLRKNVRFYRIAAAAQQAGLRAWRRCRPDASPGSPEWNTRADLAARAMRLIARDVAPIPRSDESYPRQELVESRATPGGVTIQVYRPTGRPQYGTATVDMKHVT